MTHNVHTTTDGKTKYYNLVYVFTCAHMYDNSTEILILNACCVYMYINVLVVFVIFPHNDTSRKGVNVV